MAGMVRNRRDVMRSPIFFTNLPTGRTWASGQPDPMGEFTGHLRRNANRSSYTISPIGMFITNGRGVVDMVVYFAVISLMYWGITRWEWGEKRVELSAATAPPPSSRHGATSAETPAGVIQQCSQATDPDVVAAVDSPPPSAEETYARNRANELGRGAANGTSLLQRCETSNKKLKGRTRRYLDGAPMRGCGVGQLLPHRIRFNQRARGRSCFLFLRATWQGIYHVGEQQKM